MYAKTLGLKPNFTIMDETDAKGLMKLSIDKVGVKDLEERFPTSAMVKSILSFSINCNKSIKEVVQWKYGCFAPKDRFATVAPLKIRLVFFTTYPKLIKIKTGCKVQ